MVRFLFPTWLKIPGLILFALSLLLGIFFIIFNFEPNFLEVPAFNIFGNTEIFGMGKTNNLIDESISLGIIIGGLFAGFSREKHEDEYINILRLESLVWAVYINFFILILAIILISGIGFLNVMMYNMFTILIFFVFRFNFVLMLKNKATDD